MSDPTDALRRGLAAAIRELGLPQTDREAGAFVAGMAWAFVMYVLVLVGVSWLTARALGWPL
jgi:hypothetical protein